MTMSQTDGLTPSRHDISRETITASQLFDDKRTSPFVIATIMALGMLLIGAVTWSANMPLAEVSTSTGEVVTSEALHRVQHLEGGIVSKIHVREGDRVETGDLLVEFAPKIAITELSRLQAKHAASQARLRLLTSMLDAADPLTGPVSPEHGAIVAAEDQALQARRDSFASQTAVLKQQMAERQAERNSVTVRLSALSEQIALVDEKVSALRKLADGDLLPRVTMIDAERDLSQLTGERDSLTAERKRLSERIDGTQAQIAELEARFVAEVTAEISTLTKETTELSLASSQADDRVERLQVHASVSGRVQDLEIESNDGVVAPGATLLTIVPDTSTLQIEAKVSTRDVGHVTVGDPVEIKIQTYDYSLFGKLDGQVLQLSPSSFLDSEGRPFFKAKIEPATMHLAGHKNMALAPGMTVEVDIITGQRSLLDYLITPVRKSLSSAFHER